MDNANNQEDRTPLQKLWDWLHDIISIRDGADIQGTIEGIKRDVVFRGQTVWILVASIFIASIGLNTSSAAVIIGAMLISPLMGPILGVGLAIGTNDFKTLLKSLKNLGIAVGVSLFTSTLYFMISPLDEPSAEILARIKPTFLDVLIAFFGGVAGIVAGSRREKTNVIPGVAIATALMPPLCTAGYGLASGKIAFFLGAFYLFFLNCVFIAVATIIIVRYLKFPIISILDKTKEKRFNRYMIGFIVLISLPSTLLFWEVIQESRFKAQAERFVNETMKFEGTEIINKRIIYSDTLSSIHVYTIGKEIEMEKIEQLNQLLTAYGLNQRESFWKTGKLSFAQKTELRIHQATDGYDGLTERMNMFTTELRAGVLEDIYKKNEQEIKTKDKKIALLEKEIIKYAKDTIPLKQIAKEIDILYPDIRKIGYAKLLESDKYGKTDTIALFMIYWKTRSASQTDKQNIKSWLQARTSLDTIKVLNL